MNETIEEVLIKHMEHIKLLHQALTRIEQLASEWDANKLGDVHLQTKRWKKLGEIAREAIKNNK
jgi:hypothetical protein